MTGSSLSPVSVLATTRRSASVSGSLPVPTGEHLGRAEEQPAVTVVVPAWNEVGLIGDCLAAIGAQDYPHIVEVLVVDGGSTDGTVEAASAVPGVTVLVNLGRIQAVGLNMALAQAQGSVVVRVDARARLRSDYVRSCVDALQRTGAALVGGAQVPRGATIRQRGIAMALSSPAGAGPAAFRRTPTSGRWVDTVYLGAGWTSTLRSVGGYKAVPYNEDAELAQRLHPAGGVWLDPSICSTYVVRGTVASVLRQFFRYGRGRAGTVRANPETLRPRQVAVPLVLVGLISPWRRLVATVYASVVVTAVVRRARGDVPAGAVMAGVVPLVHLAWGAGFVVGLLTDPPAPDLYGSGPPLRCTGGEGDGDDRYRRLDGSGLGGCP